MKFKLGVLKDFDKLIDDAYAQLRALPDEEHKEAWSREGARLRALLDAKKAVLKREAT